MTTCTEVAAALTAMGAFLQSNPELPVSHINVINSDVSGVSAYVTACSPAKSYAERMSALKAWSLALDVRLIPLRHGSYEGAECSGRIGVFLVRLGVYEAKVSVSA